MPGLVYINKSNQTISLTDEKYFNCPAQYKKLILRTGSTPTATIGYPLTTDETARDYSPMCFLYTNNKVCYLATYSTGSSSSSNSGTYRYTIESGYYNSRTATYYDTIRSVYTGSGSSSRTYQESGTVKEQYIVSYSTSPGETYYSSSGYCAGGTTYKGAYGGRTEYYDKGYGNPTDNYNRQTPFNGGNTINNGFWVTAAGRFGGSGGSTATSGGGKATGQSCTCEWAGAYDGRDQDGDNYHSARRREYVSTSSSWRRATTYSTGGKVVVPGGSSPVYGYSYRTTYTTHTETGEWSNNQTRTITTNTRYGYKQVYTERTSSSSNSAGQKSSWTHSNINVL